MKKSILTLTFIIACMVSAFAQSGSLTFFSQNGEKFYVILDGVRQNNAPSTHVKVTDLKRPNYKAKIIFEDSAIPPIDKNVYIQDFETKAYNDVVYNVRRDKKGVMEVRISSFSEVGAAPALATDQKVVSYQATEAPAQPAAAQPAKATTTTTQTTNVGLGGAGVNTTTTIQEDGENVSMNINLGGFGTNVTTSTTTTTTTHSTTTTAAPVAAQPKPAAAAPVAVETPPMKEQGCVKAISTTDFASGKSSIKNQSFSDSQMKVAKTFTKNNCLSVAQIKEVMGIFSFEESKLEYAKFAYDYCVDKKNYYQLSDAFSFSSSSDSLNEFLETK
jgi:hypothetical protein